MTAEDLKEAVEAAEKEASALALPPWSDEADALLKKHRDGKNTVAIVGFAPTTRHLAPYNDERVEVWSLNEAHRHKNNFMKRWTRWFQIHKDWDFTKQASAATTEHWDWLKEEHDFPIYMQDKDPRIPASEKYPFDDIVATVLGRTVQLTLTGDEIVKTYFTSSFAYMGALVLYEKLKGIKDWNRVEVYGFEMATFTEFQYQKGSTEWWMGKIDGHGLEVVIPPRCRLLSGALYGYEVSRVINRDMLEKMLLEERGKEREAVKLASMSTGKRMAYEELLTGINKSLDEVDGTSPDRRLELMSRKLEYSENGRAHFQEEIENVRKVNLQFGRTQELDDLIAYTKKAQPQQESAGISEPLINRQMLEFRMNSVRIAEQQSFQRVLMDRGHRGAYQELYVGATAEQQKDYQLQGGKAFERELNNASMTNALMGRRGMIMDLMKFIDNYDPDDKIVRTLINADPLKKAEGQ